MESERKVHTVTAACGRERRENSRYLRCIYKSSCREFLYDSRHRIPPMCNRHGGGDVR